MDMEEFGFFQPTHYPRDKYHEEDEAGMNGLETILTRRSIRKYTSEPVSGAAVETLLRAAMAAPSAGNTQPWEFVVVDDRRLLDEMREMHGHAAMLSEAPLAVLVCGDGRRADLNGHFWTQDCSAAVENILLAAHALGLGAVWLGVYPGEGPIGKLRGLLGLPREIVPFALVAVGHPAEQKPPSGRYDPARVHRNVW